MSENSVNDSFVGYSYAPEIYKMASDEVKDKYVGSDEREEWKQADAEERAKIVASGAVKVFSVEESSRFIKQLQTEGKEDRVLGSRIVRRRKPGEQPGEAPTRKTFGLCAASKTLTSWSSSDIVLL